MGFARMGMLWLGILGCPKHTPPPEVGVDPELARPLPFDPGVETGVLDNGIRWYVEHHEQPSARAVLRLVVDVGSVVEDDDQRGIAHFVEHMAFNGSAHFPGNELITYLESTGTRFGPHLNAHTSFDETVYKLAVPTDDPEVFDKAFLVLEDWATGLQFDPEEIEKERPVVLEEWRTRLGAQGRIQEATLPATFFGSPYADRLPIGTEESLRTFDADAVRRFYRDWYRPDRMAVVAVGDFDAAEVIAKIHEHFDGIPAAAADARKRPVFEIPDHADTKYVVVADPEITRASMGLLRKMDRVEGTTYGDYRRSLVENLAFSIINERLVELAQRPDAPFLGAGAGMQRMSPTEAAFVLSAATRDDALLSGYRSLLEEIRRVREHGFGEPEIARARARMLSLYENLEREEENSESVTEADELVRAFTNGEAVPGTAVEVEIAQRYVPAITAAELDAWAKDWMGPSSRVVTLLLPSKPGLAVPTEAELAAIDAEVEAMTVAPPVAESGTGELIRELPPAGSVVSTDERYAADLGFVGWTLSNGIRVWSRKTDFKADEVLMTAFSPGGTSLVADPDVVSASLMLETLGQSGFGELDTTGIQRWLAGRRASLGHGIGEGFETLSGASSPDDLDALLAQLWASVTAPKMDADGFAKVIERNRVALANRQAAPMTLFHDTYTERVWSADPRRKPWTVETLDRAELDRMAAVYADRFGDMGDFVFVFVGNLPDDFQALVEQYIATLPAAGRTETFADRGVRQTMGHIEATVASGRDPQARVRLQWRGALPDNDWEHRNLLYGLGAVMQTMLREKLREDLGGVYGVGVSASESYVPDDQYAITVEFGCDPERVDELVAATRAVVDTLRKSGPPEAIVDQEKQKNRRSREEDVRTNGFWLSSFGGALQRGADPQAILTWDQRNDALSAARVREAAKTWLVDDDLVKIVLMPEAGGAEGTGNAAP